MLLFLLNKNNSDKEISQNTKTLYEINSKKRNILVSYKNAIEQKIPDNTNFKNRLLNLSINFKINTEEFIESLYKTNFESVEFVTSPGEFSIRGYIIDIFSYSNNKPYRIVLSNDLVESITIFDVETQLSISKVTEIEIVPNIEDVNLVESSTYIFSHLKKNTIIWIEEKTSFLSELNESLKLKLKDQKIYPVTALCPI